MTMTTALASVDDLSVRGVDVSDEARAQSAIEDASVRIHTETNWVWIDASTGELVESVPDIAATVCLAAATRSLTNPDAVSSESESIGRMWSTSRTFANASPDVFLSRSEKALLRRAAGIGGLGVMRIKAPGLKSGPGLDDE